MKLNEFVFMEEHIEALQVAWKTKSNSILFGKKGHGKSDLIMAFLAEQGIQQGDPRLYKKSFHSSLDEANLYGGLDFRALTSKTDPRIRYRLDMSWINYEVVIFEEIFDAPVSTLASLKDTIISGVYSDGAEHYPVKTQLILAATNREPEEIAAMGQTYDAILDRFPIVKRVMWDKYDYDSFYKMLSYSAKPYLHDKSKLVARLAAMAHEKSFEVSPRTCWIGNKQVFEYGNPTPLRHIQGFDKVYHTVKDMEKEEAIERQFNELRGRFEKLANMPESKLNEIASKMKAYNGMMNTISNFSATNKTAGHRDKLVQQCQEVMANLQKKMIDISIN